MGLSRLAKKCQACPYVSTCDHKRMEALGYLPLPEADGKQIDILRLAEVPTGVSAVFVFAGKTVAFMRSPANKSQFPELLRHR